MDTRPFPANDSSCEPSGSHFLALLSRMRYIDRWALMRNSRAENLAEHSMDVALIAHMLCTLGNVRLGKSLNAERAALVALYHDASEIVTGDLPTPVKYYDGQIRDAYQAVEHEAEERLLATLPDDLRQTFASIVWGSPATDKQAAEAERYMRRLVKAADKISALIKCVEEARSGNQEFASAEKTCRAAVMAMAKELPEVAQFMTEFLPSYGATLDELL